MTAPPIDRETWLAEKPARNPDTEQAIFGGDVGEAAELALEDINPLNPHLFREHRWHEHFARLRREDPVHLNELGSAGRYWSVTKWDDVRAVDGDWRTFSSANGITIGPPVDTPLPREIDGTYSFIAMDPPAQTEQRRTVRGISAPSRSLSTRSGRGKSSCTSSIAPACAAASSIACQSLAKKRISASSASALAPSAAVRTIYPAEASASRKPSMSPRSRSRSASSSMRAETRTSLPRGIITR